MLRGMETHKKETEPKQRAYRRSREEVRELIRTFESCNQTLPDFARDHGVKESALRQIMNRARRREQAAADQPQPGSFTAVQLRSSLPVALQVHLPNGILLEDRKSVV